MSSSRRNRPSPIAGEERKNKKQRSINIDIGQAIDDEATARSKLEKAGFNPDRVTEKAEPKDDYIQGKVTPMFYFCCQLGDLPMCRYLFSVMDDIDIGEPIDDEATARSKLEMAGYNADYATEKAMTLETTTWMTAIAYFCAKGDLPMCRYLYMNGTHYDIFPKKDGGCAHYPMYAAAFKGQLEVCQWLHKQLNVPIFNPFAFKPNQSHTPLKGACLQGHWEVGKWLILNGALHFGDNGCFNAKYAKRFFDTDTLRTGARKTNVIKFRAYLTSWAEDTVSMYDTFCTTILMGTLSSSERTTFKSESLQQLLSLKLGSDIAAKTIVEMSTLEIQKRLWRNLLCPLRVFSGVPGTMEIIAGFVGVECGRTVKVARDVMSFMKSERTY